MLWEGGWEWARLTKSKYISIEVTCPPPFLLLIYIYTPPPPFWGYARPLSPSLAPPAPENLHSVRSCPKKVEKTSSENTTFAKSEHPYRTCGSLGGFFFFFDFLGDARSGMQFFGGRRSERRSKRASVPPEGGRRSIYIYIRSRNGGRGRGRGRGQVTSIEMYFDLVSLAHSHPPSHNISSTSGQPH